MKTEIAKLTEAVSDLQSSRNIEPIMIDDAPKQERQIPYKVVQYVEDTESVWEDGSPKKIFQWFWNTFKSKEDAEEYYNNAVKNNPWFKYDIFPV